MGIKNSIQAILRYLGIRKSNHQVKILSLPVDNAAISWTATAATFIYYLLSMYPDLSVWDSSLIALVAIQGGLGHPPGYPLHTLLGTIMSHLPGVDPLTGVKLLSVIPGALMCIPMLSLVSQMKPESSSRNVWYGSWLAAAFVVLLCIHPVLWDPATRVEVYSLAAFLATWGVARLGATLSPPGTASTSSAGIDRKGLFVAGLALGASASVNPVVAAVITTAAFTTLFKTVFRTTLGWRALLRIAAGGLTGMLPYVWIPLVAARTDRFVWGAPTDVTSLWHFLSARDFAAKVGPDTATVLSHLFDWVGWSVITGTMLFVAMGIIGWIILGKRSAFGRSAPLAFALVVLAICNNKVWIPENPDYLGYLSGPLAICAAGGAALLMHLDDLGELRFRLVSSVGLIVIITVSVFASPALYSRNRHVDRTARMIAKGAYDETPQGGIVLVSSDHWFSPMFFLQEIEKVRQDVVLLPFGMANSLWYWKRLYRLHPKLKPFTMNGPGGKIERVARFLSANSDRHVSVENARIAILTGIRFKDVGWLLLEEPASDQSSKNATDEIDRAAAVLGKGSPDGMGTLSLVSYIRAEALWRIGRPLDAYRSLLAGVPPSMRPTAHPPDERWETVPSTRPFFPPNASIRGLGDPHLNIKLADYLAQHKEAPKTTEALKSTKP